MAQVKIDLPHVLNGRSQIIYENHFEEVKKAIPNALKNALADIVQQAVSKAQRDGDYENRTGNLRRMITSNPDHATDDPKTYPSVDVTFVDSDGTQKTRPQYKPPADFDKTQIEERDGGEKLVGTVAAIMPYAAPLEAKGYNVLTPSVDHIVANAGSEIKDKLDKSDLTDRRTKAQRLAFESGS